MNRVGKQESNAWVKRLILAISFFIPAIFWRGTIDAFDLVKGSALWVLTAVALVFVIARPACLRSLPESFVVSSGMFGFAICLVTSFSMDPAVSVWGQSQRYTGSLTLLSCVVLALLVAAVFVRDNASQMMTSLLLAGVVVSFYSWLQEIGADPFTWSVTSFGKFVFGTMGNPNTASGLVATVVPLASYFLLEGKSPAARFFAGASFGLLIGSLASLGSFQGSVAVLSNVLFLGLWYALGSRNFGQFLIAALLVGASILLPNLSGNQLGTITLLSTIAFGLVGYLVPSVSKWRIVPTKIWISSVSLIGIVLIALFGPKVLKSLQDGLSGGMTERGDFYRAAIRAFADNPVVGTGIETFGFVFSEYRPESHALRLEGSRTSSVHSVHLGMFANGGIILGLAYLLFIAVTARFLIKGITNSKGSERLVVLAVGSAWLASQIQALVSVEHVALLSTQFVLSGMVVAVGKESYSRSVRRREPRRFATATLVMGALLIPILAWTTLLKPLRANVASKSGLTAAYQQGDGAAAIRDLGEAIELAPWEGLYRVQRAEVFRALQMRQEAALDASEAVQLLHESPAVTVAMAQIVAEGGDIALATGFVELALQRDPYALGLKSQASDFFIGVGSFLVESGSPNEARMLLERALDLTPSNQRALDGLASLGT
jgi:hypothetical protein